MQVITNGQPGNNPTIRIRGLGTIGNNDPLVVVDGMPLNGGLNQVNLNDVASIQVLKDASATAIYGARGANGVVIIQTKRGSGDETRISFDMYEGVAQATDQVEVLNAAQFADFHNDMLGAGGIPLNPEFRNPAALGEGTDWVGEFFRPAALRNYTLSYTGGNERSRVYTSFNYFDQQGVVQNTDYQRFILQFNTDTWATDFLKFGNTLKLNHDIKRSGDFSVQWALISLPTQSIYDSLGNFATAAVPTVLPNANVQWESQEQYNLGLDLSLLKSRVNLSLEAYLKNTRDMLVPQSVPVTSGYSEIFVPFVNAGQIQNRGLEVLLSTVNIERENLRWTSDFVFTYNQNEVIDINSDIPLTTGNIGLNFALSRIQNGYPVNVFYGYQTDGLFQTPEEVAAHAQQWYFGGRYPLSRPEQRWPDHRRGPHLSGLSPPRLHLLPEQYPDLATPEPDRLSARSLWQ